MFKEFPLKLGDTKEKESKRSDKAGGELTACCLSKPAGGRELVGAGCGPGRGHLEGIIQPRTVQYLSGCVSLGKLFCLSVLRFHHL